MAQHLRALLVGAGGMGRAWAKNLAACDEVVIAGWMDILPGAAAQAAHELGITVGYTGDDGVVGRRADRSSSIGKDNSKMDSQVLRLPHQHQVVIDHFVAACQADLRVLAAFLRGSHASATADAYSDLDLGLITADETYEDFFDGREAFLRLLGEPLFLETFDLPNFVFFIFADGTEGELALGRASGFNQISRGAYRVLLDKKGLLAGAVFPGHQPTQAEQVETVRRLVYWFWHDLSHFITAMGRGQLWWAHGQLEELRRYCVNLARLRHNFSAEAEGYEKVEQALPVEQLSPLQATYCPLEQAAMLQAGVVIVRFYQDLAPLLARTHALPYPDGLERMMVERLEQLCKAHAVVIP